MQVVLADEWMWGCEVCSWVAVGRYMVECIADMYIVATSDGRTTL